MSSNNGNVQFEPLVLRHCVLAEKDVNRYCVRDVSGKEREIKAETAYEAFRKSETDGVIKIERVFSLGYNILDKSKLINEPLNPAAKDASSAVQDEAGLHDRIRRRRNPILSADELDEIMRAIQHSVVDSNVATQDSAVPPPVAGVEQTAASATVPPPAPADAALVPENMTSPIGIEVHGDGFDEIIPAPAKPAMPHKAADAKETLPAAAPAAEFPPERELSSEEVNKLLGGK